MAEINKLVRWSKHWPPPPFGAAPVAIEVERSERDPESGNYGYRVTLKVWGEDVGGLGGSVTATDDMTADCEILHKALTYVCERYAEKVEKRRE